MITETFISRSTD